MKSSFLFRQLLFPLLAVTIMLSSSCGKKSNNNGNSEGATPQYYISFKANGIQKKYTGQALASLGYSGQNGLYNAVLQGYQGTVGADREHIGVVIFSNNAVGVNTYQDPQKAVNASGDEVPQVLISYYDAAGNGYLSLGPMVDEKGNANPFPGSENVVADAKVSLTKRTDVYVEGTFSGTVFLSTDAAFKTKVAITEGKFLLKAYALD